MSLPNYFPVTCHTDHVGPGSTFVAIQGFATDGAHFVATALQKGATRVLIQADALLRRQVQEQCAAAGVPCEVVTNARLEMALRAARACGNPEQKLCVIGITGTKGKTTTSDLVRQFLTHAGYKVALLGTVQNMIGDEILPAARTTPESDYLAVFLAAAVAAGCSHVVLEVSSHALSLDRVAALRFDAVGFTNLAHEHLDFYQSMQDYFDAKCRLFTLVKQTGVVVINADDVWGQRAMGLVTAPHKALVPMQLCDGQPTEPGQYVVLRNTLDGLALQVSEGQIAVPVLFGDFNAANLAMAYQIARACGLTHAQLVVASALVRGIPGRLERIPLPNGAVGIVDYAHNPSSFQAVLSALRPLTNDLIVVFGCGGNRDPYKRPEMGRIAAQFGDSVVVTSDNPRNEDPYAIVEQILAGISADKHDRVHVVVDRALAIKSAVTMAKTGSIVAVLGKGHETTFTQNGLVWPFDDRVALKLSFDCF